MPQQILARRAVMIVLFLHGKNGAPGGVKPTYLTQHGLTVINPALPDDDFDAAVDIAQQECVRQRPDVVCGSSRGGAVAMALDCGPARLLLLCPAWRNWGAAASVKPGTIVLHARADDVVPFADSEFLVRRSSLPATALIEIGSDHRLSTPDALAQMLTAVKRSA